MIELSDFSCGYHGKRLFEPFSLKVSGHLNILGANGSGKSSLAKALCGLLPYSGSVELFGEELRETPRITSARRVAYIPSKLEAYDTHTTVEDFILTGRYPYKEPYRDYSAHDHVLVTQMANKLELSALLDRRVHELSSGQQQLVLITQALVQQSELFLFDEPTANLDPAHTVSFSKRLADISKTHTTLLITHDLQLAMQLGGAVLFLNEGHAHYFANADEFFQPEVLEHFYGIAFERRGSGVAVCYA